MDTYLAVASKRDWRSYADRPVPEDVQRRILDAGRVSGSSQNVQPWRFVVVESDEAKQRVGELVYAAANVESCAFADRDRDRGRPLPAGRRPRAAEHVPGRLERGRRLVPERDQGPEAAASALGLDEGWVPVNIPSFGYPKRDLAPESKSAEEWSAEANRKPLDELIRRI